MENRNSLMKLITDLIIIIMIICFCIGSILEWEEPDNYLVITFIALCFNSLNLKK